MTTSILKTHDQIVLLHKTPLSSSCEESIPNRAILSLNLSNISRLRIIACTHQSIHLLPFRARVRVTLNRILNSAIYNFLSRQTTLPQLSSLRAWVTLNRILNSTIYNFLSRQTIPPQLSSLRALLSPTYHLYPRRTPPWTQR
jgi:hypothetical protein